jgi:hypothetical protein
LLGMERTSIELQFDEKRSCLFLRQHANSTRKSGVPILNEIYPWSEAESMSGNEDFCCVRVDYFGMQHSSTV